MLRDSKAFSGFSVHDLDTARTFYADTLGLTVEDGGPGFWLRLAGRRQANSTSCTPMPVFISAATWSMPIRTRSTGC